MRSMDSLPNNNNIEPQKELSEEESNAVQNTITICEKLVEADVDKSEVSALALKTLRHYLFPSPSDGFFDLRPSPDEMDSYSNVEQTGQRTEPQLGKDEDSYNHETELTPEQEARLKELCDMVMDSLESER